MNINGLNFLSPSLQADQANFNLIGKATVNVPGGRGKKLAMSTDVGLIGAVGLGEPLSNGDVYGTELQLALKFANASSQSVLLESVDLMLHNKHKLRLVSIPEHTSIHEMAQDNLELPDIKTRNHKNLLPILLPPHSERSYVIHFSLKLHYKRRFKKTGVISVPHEAIIEPDTYEKYFKMLQLTAETSAGRLRIECNVPLFVGQVLKVPEIKSKLRAIKKDEA